MRMAYVCMDAGVPVFGTKGCSLHVQEMLRAFLKLGFEIELFSTNLKGKPPNDLAQIITHAIPVDVKDTDIKQRENILINNNSKLQKLLTKTIEFDLIYERHSLWSYAAIEFARKYSIPGIVEVNAPLIEEQKKYRKLIQHGKAFLCSYRCLNAADQVVIVSSGIKPYLERFSINANNISVIANGVNPNRFLNSIKNRENITLKDNFNIGFVGSLKPWHGVDILIDAFSKFSNLIPNSRLLIVGDGPEREHLENQADQLKVKLQIEFTGSVCPEQIPNILNRMDVAVAPYPNLSEFYFSPIKVYEYMAAELAVIASNIGQLTDLIDNEKDGLLCEPGNVDELQNSIMKLYKSPELRQKLGQNARRKILSDHTWDDIARKITQLAA